MKKLFLSAFIFLAALTSADALTLSASWMANPDGFKCWIPGGSCRRTVTITFKVAAVDRAFDEAEISVDDEYEKGVITSGVDNGEFVEFDEITIPDSGIHIPAQTAVWSSELGGYLIYFTQ